METSIEINTNLWTDCQDEWLRTRRSANTRRAFEYALQDYLAVTGLACPSEGGRPHMLRWVEDMKRRGLQPATVKARIIAVSSLYRFACEEYLVDGEPLADENPAAMSGIRPKVKRYAKSRALTRDEVVRLLGAIDLTQQNGPRDYALLAGYLVLGRRNSEWRLARVCDFEVSGDEIFYRWAGKGKADEVASVPDDLWRVLQGYIAASGGRGVYDYIFLDRSGTHPLSGRRIGQLLKRYARLAGLSGEIRVHDLRHTAALLRRLAGADVEEIRDFLGHSSLQMTQIYLHRIERASDERGRLVARMIKI